MLQWAFLICLLLFINMPFLQCIHFDAEFWDIPHSRFMFYFISNAKLFIKAVTPISTSPVSEYYVFHIVRLLNFFSSTYISCLFLINDEVKNPMSYVYWSTTFPILWNAWLCRLLIFYLIWWTHSLNILPWSFILQNIYSKFVAYVCDVF